MKNKTKALLIALAGFQLATSAMAQTSVERSRDSRDFTLREQVWGLTPQLGQISYTDRSDTYTSRGTVGVTFDLNAASTFGYKDNDMYLGFNTGIFYAHPGATGANFFGSGNVEGQSNLLLIPVNAKIGYNLSDSFRLSAHGGGNVIYRSIASSINLGEGSNSSDSIWKMYPNAGLDAELQLSKNLSLVAHPDITFTTGNSLFVATLGATFIGY